MVWTRQNCKNLWGARRDAHAAMTNYRRGYAAELRAKRILERQGWFVIRSAGSHSPLDLVAFRGLLTRGVFIRMIQVKRNAYLSRHDRDELGILKRIAPPHTAIECWRFVGRGKPLIEVL